MPAVSTDELPRYADTTGFHQEVEQLVARKRSDLEPGEIAFRAVCRAVDSFDGSASVAPEEFAAAFYDWIEKAARRALDAAGYGHLDVGDFGDDIQHAMDSVDAATWVAAEGGGSEDYAMARAYANAADWRPADDVPPVLLVVTCSGRHRRAPGAAPVRTRGSRRCSSRSAGGGSSGDDDDGEPSPPRLKSWRHLNPTSSSPRPALIGEAAR